MALEMKYFILKPRSKKYGDRFAKASREAMVKFADEIADIDPDLAQELRLWVGREEWKEVNKFYAPKYPWHPTESDMKSSATTWPPQELEPAGGNVYKPHKMWVGCEECKKDDSEAYAKWLREKKKA